VDWIIVTKEEAVNFFGSQVALAEKLGIRQASVAEWINVPPLRQLQLERLTKGKLRADRNCIPN
jgi:DNA-binding transcriptional regulator YdaS (Cro superfamily)